MSDDLSCRITTTPGDIISTTRDINVDIRKGENENERLRQKRAAQRWWHGIGQVRLGRPKAAALPLCCAAVHLGSTSDPFFDSYS